MIIAGLMVIAYPAISEIYLNHRQDKLMEEWADSLALIDDNSDTGEEEIGEDLPPQVIALEEMDQQEKEDRRKEFRAQGIEGILSIEKIDLKLPILSGSTKSNLRKSVASIANTGSLGQVGNYGIAGHRNRTYGSIFNRLDEVEIGDEIGLDNGGQTYQYQVVEKLYVKPEDTWVLNGNKKDKEVTLITCHPQINPTHRLIIKGKIVEKD